MTARLHDNKKKYLYTMGQGTLTIYSASAGSGKTFNLAKAYLTRLFESRYNYRRILAVTFTNKATAEMKSRILDQLHILSTGGKSDYLADLISSTSRSEEYIRKEAGDILFSILHDFSRFSVSTIDAFFQKILRAFTREAGLHSGFNIELDHSLILSSAVDEMIASSSSDPRIRNWLTRYVIANIDEEKTWDLKGDIMKLAEELFREKFRILSNAESTRLEDKDFLLEYIRRISNLRTSIENETTALGKRCEKMLNDYGLTDDMFFQKGKGVPGFIRELARGSVIRPGAHVLKILEDPPRWSTGKPAQPLLDAIAGGLSDALKEAIRTCNLNYIIYQSADTVLSNIYALGILSDVLKRVHEVAASENSFLLSDAGEVLCLITREDQTPFIYEKIGNTFANYMIDEFQDTSWLQWKNFDPLINESMGRGFDNLVVGDIKQSIYRWRNSDWQILAGMKDNLVDNERFLSKPLVTNWRSRSNIIRFNNSLFSVIPALTDESFSEGEASSDFMKIYSEAVQEDPGRRDGGYVRIEFIDDEREDKNDRKSKITRTWEDTVLEKLPGIIESVQERGYKASDIGILVRQGKDGEAVVRRMIEYAGSLAPEQRSRYNYKTVSSDSLSLSSSHAVNFIISALKALDDPGDMISRAQMVRFLLLATGKDNPDKAPLFTDLPAGGTHSSFPEGFSEFIEKAAQMPLFEATENIIGFFGLGNYSWNVAYLDTFQDLVLGFSGSRSNDLKSFIEWWETTGKSKSVVMPAAQDAVRVFTIHKSKGLEFRIVILPFISWNLDHKPSKYPILWAKPDTAPFNDLGIIPVRYGKLLSDTIFADDYISERYSVFIDNINLLYVAMTRAMDAMWGFAPETPSTAEAIASALRSALSSDRNPAGGSGITLKSYFSEVEGIFEYGELPEQAGEEIALSEMTFGSYSVSRRPGSLRLKLHAENYFSADTKEKISYGKLMHSVFENIDTAADIPSAVRTLVLDGILSGDDAPALEEKLKKLVSGPPASEWFMPGVRVMKEAGILLPSGHTRRPDRIIIKEGSAIIIDFKFGEENPHYASQLKQYRKLMEDMGYRNIEAFLWYVDKNKIITV
jgi:ATP-dependent exoDNAse (exonuclease V) beta subunit